MVTYENQCCDCATESYPCIGDSCSMWRVKILVCDKCKQEVDTLYRYDGQELCYECFIKDLEVIE
jgi:hypothetical protein